jgi:hypothetical protein
MNTVLPNTQTGPAFFLGVLIALLALMVIALTAPIGMVDQAHVSSPSLLVQRIQGEMRAHPALPMPVPVPTPKAVESQSSTSTQSGATATPTPPIVAQPAPLPIPQPVPTPPAN